MKRLVLRLDYPQQGVLLAEKRASHTFSSQKLTSSKIERRRKDREESRSLSSTPSKIRQSRSDQKTPKADKRVKRAVKGSQKNSSFSVWRAISKGPRISKTNVISGLLFMLCFTYGVFLILSAREQLETQRSTQGLLREFYPSQEIVLSLGPDEPPLYGRLIDPRLIDLWPEIKRRFGKDLGDPSPLIDHVDQEVNRGAWRTSLRSKGVDFVESLGVGAAGEVSLVWPPPPAPSPTLIVGHYYDKIAWLDPKQGVILSLPPQSWQRAPSLKLPPQMSRRW